MAVELVSDYEIGDASLNDLMTSTDDQRYGFHQVTLTEWSTSTKPEVAAGSRFENNGALYKVTTDTAISGSPTGKTYIVFDVSALTFSFSNTAPTWADDKQGFYGTGGTENDRYLLFKMDVSGASYTTKRHLNNNVDGNDLLYHKTIDIGDWVMWTGGAGYSSSVSISHGLVITDIRDIRFIIRSDGGTLRDSNYTGVTSASATADASEVGLGTVTGGGFDTSTYDSTSFNRGFIIITYV